MEEEEGVLGSNDDRGLHIYHGSRRPCPTPLVLQAHFIDFV